MSVEKAFEKHHTEIKRRAEILNTEEKGKRDTFEHVKTDVCYPFEMENMKFCLYSVSHVGWCPYAEKASEPGIRFLGCFATAEEATLHARVVQREDPSCNVQLTACHQFAMATSTPERLADDAACRKHVQDVLDYYKRMSTEEEVRFEDRVKIQKSVVADKEKEERARARKAEEAEEAAKELGTETRKELTLAPALGRGAEVRDQNYAVVTFLPDRLQTIPEFVFKVYACFNTLEEANIYCTNVCCDVVKDVDVDVVQMYSYLHPQNVTGEKVVSERFRSEELEAIMKQHKKAPTEVRAFEKWRQEGREKEETSEGELEEKKGTEASGA